MAEEVVDGISSYVSDDLGEAATAWGNELALENGEELPEEDNQSMSDSAEEEPVEEFEQDEEYEEDEDEPEEQRFEVKSDGEVKSVTLKELQDNFSKGENYTQKSQGLSEERKAFENEVAEARQMREQAISILESAQAQTQPVQQDQAYWDNLKDTDPMTYFTERDALRESQMQEHQRSIQLEQLRAQESSEMQQQHEQYLSSQRVELKSLVPEWDDVKVADTEKKLVLEWASTQGRFTKEELDNAYDARAVAVMRKAMLYDKIQEKRKGLKPIQRQSMRAGSQSEEPSKMKAGKASQRLKKSGSVEDAAGVFYNMIRSK
jgi:hypothetical protein